MAFMGTKFLPPKSPDPRNPVQSLPDTSQFLITNFGARSDESRVNTREIQSTIDACARQGGGMVTIPAGRFITGTLRLRSRVYLHISSGGILAGSKDPNHYPAQPAPAYRSLKDQAGFRALIYADSEENIGICGEGLIDGQGRQFPFQGNDMDGRPRLMQFVSCKDVRVENVRLQDSALWMQHYLDCERVQISGLRIWNHANHNNDMFDIDGCRGVTIRDCIGDSGDDGITLKSTGSAPCEDIVVTNCVLSSHCNAIKCGTESTGGFRNIAITNCVIRPSKHALVINGRARGISGVALEIVDGGTLDGVSVANLVIEGTASPLFVRLGNRARKHRPDAPEPGVGTLRNVSLTNIHVRDAGPFGCSISGIPSHSVENISLSGIRITMNEAGTQQDIGRIPPERENAYPEATMFGRLPAYGFFLRHAKNVNFIDAWVTPHESEARPAYVGSDTKNIRAVACSFAVDHSEKT